MKYFAPHDSIDCGPVCLKMIANHYGRDYSIQHLKSISNIDRQGVSIYGLTKAAEKIGFETTAAEVSLGYLLEKVNLPCILYWDGNHFVVLHRIRKDKSKVYYYIADPGTGKVRLDEEGLTKYWLNQNGKGFAILLNPSNNFSILPESPNGSAGNPFNLLARYFVKFKGNYLQVFFTFCATTIVAFVFPFLTQAIVDYGIKLKDLNFVALILAFQLFLFGTSTLADVIRSHLLLHIGSRINISILSDFLRKMVKLPIKFFETKLPGDLIQRIHDHAIIEEFISSSLLTFTFSFLNIVIYSSVLFYYNPLIFVIFIVGSTISICWALLFLKWRKSLNYLRFSELANSNNYLFEMASQMHEIKANRFEKYKISQWEAIKARLFNLDVARLSMEQYQRIGSEFFDQVRTILIIFFAVYSVIQGDLTLGMMLAISYIIGQLNVPIKDVSRLITMYQSASIGLDRMNEVYTERNEADDATKQPQGTGTLSWNEIELRGVSFGYNDDPQAVLKDINLSIPAGKTTAIVGASGGGKTTLLKLLLRFYQPTKGKILLNGQDISHFSIDWWRGQCGAVLQEGYIFNETIKRNIIMDDDDDPTKLAEAIDAANMTDFVLDQPLSVDTKIGNDGSKLSTGQKQRILIARAIYKKPSILFLDEATSSLDAKNEKEIIQNLKKLYEGRTVVVIAHRLSTVKNADQIAVLDGGRIAEIGTHDKLVAARGIYFDLVQNQLELAV